MLLRERSCLRAVRRRNREYIHQRLGAISKHGLAPLRRIAEKLTSTRYCDVVDTMLISYLRSGLFPDRDVIFQQDLAPIHTPRIVMDRLYQCGIQELPWVPKGAVINIVETVRGRMKDAMIRKPIDLETADQLKFEQSANALEQAHILCMLGSTFCRREWELSST